MRTEKAEGPQEPNDKRRPRSGAAKPRRTGANGPIGFGTVMRDVRAPKGAGAITTPGSAGFDPAAALAAQLNAGAQAAASMGAVPSTEQLANEASHGVESATDALAKQDASVSHASRQEAAVPTTLGRMSPSVLLEKVVDEATRHAIDEASKELHVELEPAHLGPLVVRLRRGEDGRLEILFRARQGDAARVLDAGLGLLHERLTDAGFPGSDVRVEHDADLTLAR
jgi:flagellar hook-length control protein FliK